MQPKDYDESLWDHYHSIPFRYRLVVIGSILAVVVVLLFT